MTPAEVTSKQLAVPKAGRYRIDPAASTVTIRTRHLFGLGPVRATLALRDGRIQVAAPLQASAVTARFAASPAWSRSASTSPRTGSQRHDNNRA